MTALRVVFMGTPALAGVCLQRLLSSRDFQVLAVVTQPDRPKGRNLKLQASPVKELALSARLPVLQPERARDENLISELRKLEPDLIAVAAYGQILPGSILELPRFGCLNVHTSLLPRYRGAAPVQWAILNGEVETGVTIMKMDLTMDTGDILTQEKTPIHAEDTSETVHDRLAAMGAELLVRTVPEYVAGKITARPQPAEGVSYAPKIKKQDGRIDWTQPARAVCNRVRALVPWPGAFTFLAMPGPPCLLKIWQAQAIDGTGAAGEILQSGKTGIVVACGQGALRILVAQREAGRRLTAEQFLAGHALAPGQYLS